MAEIRQKARGTTSQLDAHVGAEGQIAVDLSREELRLYDGVAAGGKRFPNKDVNDAAYVRNAELASEPAVKAINQQLTTTSSPTFASATAGTMLLKTFAGSINGLIPGSSAGGMIEGPNQQHVAIGVPGNDVNDGFYVVISEAVVGTYDKLLLAVSAAQFSYNGNQIWHAGALVDGRDIAADGAKLDGIEPGAEANVPTNLSLTGVGNAKTVVSSTGTNVNLPLASDTDAGLMSLEYKTKLDGIAAGAQVNVATNLGIGGDGNARTVTSSTGSDANLPVASATNAGLMATGDKSKLDGIEAGAEVTSTDKVQAAGALMDSELTNEAAVKAINQQLTTESSPGFNQVSTGSTIYGTYSGGAVAALVPGSTFGALVRAGVGGQYVIGVRGNDSQDGFHVVDSQTSDDAFDELLLTVCRARFQYRGDDIVLAPRSVNAGLGLNGGGDLSTNRTLALNSALDALGTYAFMQYEGTEIAAGAAVAGSALRFSGMFRDAGSGETVLEPYGASTVVPSGTWRAMMASHTNSGASHGRGGVFMRIV